MPSSSAPTRTATGCGRGLARTVVPVRGYTAVSRPLEDHALDRVLPQRHFLMDTRHLWSGIRKLPGNRLQLGVGGPPLGRSARADLAGATRRVKMVFPELGAVDWEESWSGWVALTGNQLPRILRLDHGVWAALGYSGRGLSFATLLGRELARLAGGSAPDEAILPVEEMRPPARPRPGSVRRGGLHQVLRSGGIGFRSGVLLEGGAVERGRSRAGSPAHDR